MTKKYAQSTLHMVSCKIFTKKVNLYLFSCLCTFFSYAQDKPDGQIIARLYDEALRNPAAYHWLEVLCKDIGGRLSGSLQAELAIEYTRSVLDTLGLDRVFLQEVYVPHWVRGEKEQSFVFYGEGVKEPLNICALGNSVGTGNEGIRASIVEVQDFEELASLGSEGIRGKIVFFNKPMDVGKIHTFEAYAQSSPMRVGGASEAAKYGAVGVIVRSLTTAVDNFPHTGTLRYTLNLPKLPAVAISTQDAETLSSILKKNPQAEVYIRTTCQNLPDVLSYNVIGEIKGSTYPDEIIVVGGHLDSWDLGEGAHDDGTGCVQSMEVLRLFKTLDIRPKRTIRAVLFMNEENGLKGGIQYAALAEAKGEKHLAALESDAGGFTPRGFTVDDTQAALPAMQAWVELLGPYGIEYIKAGYGGADISPLRNQGVTLIGYRPDDQRYFYYHHTADDTFDKVNMRELQLGSAAMASLIYLISEYGL